MSDLVSIITPCYNSAKYIAATIESVINQTYGNWEMIIIDDDSIDNTTQIINQYIEKDRRIKLIKLSKNRGTAIARNIGIETAKGRYIAFLDSDDLWLPEKLEKQILFIKENKLPLTFSSYFLIDSNENIIGIIKVKNKITYKNLLKKSSFIPTLTGVYDVSYFGKVYMENFKKAEDYTFWIKIMEKVKIAYGIKEPLAKYRVYPKSRSFNKFEAAKQQWLIYRNFLKFNMLKSSYYFMHYAFNGIKVWSKIWIRLLKSYLSAKPKS